MQNLLPILQLQPKQVVFLSTWQEDQNVLERWAMPVRYRQQEKPLDEIISLQAKRLAGHLAGEGTYRPFIGRW